MSAKSGGSERGGRNVSRVGSHTELLESPTSLQSPPSTSGSGSGALSPFSEDDHFNIALLMRKHSLDRSAATLLYLKQKNSSYWSLIRAWCYLAGQVNVCVYRCRRRRRDDVDSIIRTWRAIWERVDYFELFSFSINMKYVCTSWERSRMEWWSCVLLLRGF